MFHSFGGKLWVVFEPLHLKLSSTKKKGDEILELTSNNQINSLVNNNLLPFKGIVVFMSLTCICIYVYMYIQY